MNTQHRQRALLLLSAGSIALLAGCGGGGGNGNTAVTTGTTGTTGTMGTTGTGTGATGTGATGTSQVAGKVTDTFGNGIPGVTISVDTGGQLTSTISTGGYRLNNLSVAVHKITATATVNGTAYSGSTQVLTTETNGVGNLNSNVNILLSQTSAQTVVEGFVRDSSGNPIAGASVYAAVPNVAIPAKGNPGTYSSLAAFTDSTGFYQIANIPSALPAGSLLVTAAAAGDANQNATISQNSIVSNGIYTQNFTLATTATAQADTPVITAINAFTQPDTGLTQSSDALQAHSASGPNSVYEGLRRRLSPAYAADASRTRTVGKRALARSLTAHAATNGYAVEVDVAFSPPASTDVNLAGYDVYRTAGPLATNPVTETVTGANADGYDSLLDPLANYYTDLTASSDPTTTTPPIFGPYAAGTQYNFALSSFSTSVPSQQSGLSAAFSITPLSPITLTVPVSGSAVTSPVTLTWTAVTGATRYIVFLYSQYPSAGTTPFTSQTFLTGTTSASVMLAGGGTTYYAVVVAGEDETETTTAGAALTTNAAQSYSEIVPFTVQ